MNVPLDEPLRFEKSRCRICRKTDARWRIFHLCDDGFWRNLKEGLSLREHGIDGTEDTLYFIHHCCESLVLQFSSRLEIEEFFMQMRE